MGRVFLGMLVLGRLLPVSVPCLELGRHLNVDVRSRGHRAAVPVNRSSVGAGRRHVEGWQWRESPRCGLTGAQEPRRRGQGTVRAGDTTGAGRWPSSWLAMHQSPPDAATRAEARSVPALQEGG